jgi:sec-independent protein translocase protein TatA
VTAIYAIVNNLRRAYMISFKNLIVILIIVLILFGAKKIPELARGIGKGLREFKKAIKENDIEDIKSELDSAIKPDSEGDE